MSCSKATLQSQSKNSSLDIRVLSEVEKIWIIHNINAEQSLCIDEASNFIKMAARPTLRQTDEELNFMFQSLDKNDDGMISKEEMIEFLTVLFQNQDVRFSIDCKAIASKC